ncbi:hypothetical protein Ais01nite_01090 [Asanoa ishikariensis]|uniref:Radical SAM core domain-containing protein n=1 Tax=Asanoa ishikariensis TaxID=137265 RepID=A0A1H3TR62_9ACTN|nr:FxsB family cyclophane-forming radical SAM/SPASM peptide maturase [Asanoa ishikariensis]GIF62074.1 hypothetical protein Ais01nite_01090 [Asanoa ishikariensis]SDZ51829.1 uncharacterized protein SAMN05421684_6113 [Asanoa ishikariensis]
MDLAASPRPATWPVGHLDVDQLAKDGWSPEPFHQFVVKVHSRCNLACDYCYMYESADQSWRSQPKVMSEQTFATACRQIAEHARRHRVPEVGFVFHGGEPLLVGARRLDRFATIATETIGPVASLRMGMQTNGVLFDEDIARTCAAHGIRVAVSVDGAGGAHDRHRRFRDGAGSYRSVVAGIERLSSEPFRHLYAGLLCTIDLANDPVETYESLVGLRPPIVDFLLPHGNWTQPPPGRVAGGPPVYADWLIRIFDRWYRAPELETRVRLFEDIMGMLLGRDRSSESIGLGPVRVAVIETDGSIEQVDTLKTAFAGATKVVTSGRNPLDSALRTPEIVVRQIGAKALCDTCLDCPAHRICGAGNYTHRYAHTTGFLNPSVYCPDLFHLIAHITAQLNCDLSHPA